MSEFELGSKYKPVTPRNIDGVRSARDRIHTAIIEYSMSRGTYDHLNPPIMTSAAERKILFEIAQEEASQASADISRETGVPLHERIDVTTTRSGTIKF